MKAALVATLVVVVLVGVVAAVYFAGTFEKVLSSTLPSNCNDASSISSHVHSPSRLIIVKSCVTASGSVSRIFEANDGDYDMRLTLDQAYRNLSNAANDRYQNGDLVVEIVCAHPPTDTSAKPSCQNYVNQIPLPQVGQHITVKGPYVLDTGHGNWAEIHPVYSLVIS